MVTAINDKEFDFDLELMDRYAVLVAGFFSISEREARERLDEEYRNPGSLVAQSWNLADPQTPDEITRYYLETDSYIYDLAADHCRARRRPVWDAIIARLDRRGPAQNVLMYGDGIGADSIALARRGHRVTYFDLPGKTARFARFQFEKEGLQDQITVLDKETEIPSSEFDAVVCIEVFEHLPDPLSTMECIYRVLKNGGIGLVTESFESIGPEYPSHIPENFKYAGKTHRLMETLGFANTYYNTDPINRPMEFTKIEGNLSGETLRLKGRLLRAVNSRWRRITNA